MVVVVVVDMHSIVIFLFFLPLLVLRLDFNLLLLGHGVEHAW